MRSLHDHPEKRFTPVGQFPWEHTFRETTVEKLLVQEEQSSDTQSDDLPSGKRQVTQLLAHCNIDISRKELMSSLKLKGRDNFEKLYLRPAMEQELIERTTPDKPNCRLQKYRLTEKGRKLLEEGFEAQRSENIR